MRKVTVANNVGHAFLVESPEEANVIIGRWRKAGELLKIEHDVHSMDSNYFMEMVSKLNLDITKMTQDDSRKIVKSIMKLKSPINSRLLNTMKFGETLRDSLRESSDIIFSNVDLTEIDWTSVPLVNFTFTGTCKVDVKKMISDSHSKVDGCVFMDMDLTPVNWEHKFINNTIFDNCKMNVNDILSNKTYSSGNVFSNMNLAEVDWKDTSLYQTMFYNSNVNYINMIRDATTIFSTDFVDIDLTGVDVDLTKHSLQYLELCKFVNCFGISDEFKYNVVRHNILSRELVERSGDEEELRNIFSIYDPKFKTAKTEAVLEAEIKCEIDAMFNNSGDNSEALSEYQQNVQSIKNILADIRTNTATSAS